MTVLIVDDSPLMRRVIERVLRQAGMAITCLLEASNGREALELMRSGSDECADLRLILIDINMPQMDGLELVEQMRAEQLLPKVPIVMVTTDTTEAQVRRALNAEVSGYLRKPFTAEQVRATVMAKLALL